MAGRRNRVVGLMILALLLTAGVGFENPPSCRAAESSGMENFHFFQEPPEANDIRMIAADGRPFSLSQLKGRVVLLNFWRQNCRYCHQEKGYLKEMLKALNSDDLVAVCVDFWDKPAWVKTYAKENEGDILFAYQPPGPEAVMENVVKGRMLGYFILNESKEATYEIKGFPSTYVIDREGRVVAAHLGMAQWTDPMIMKWLAALIQPPGAPFSPADAYYETPEWLDWIMAGLPTGRVPRGRE